MFRHDLLFINLERNWVVIWFEGIEFFLNNTNLTFLTFLYKIDIVGFQKVSAKTKLSPVGIELAKPILRGLEV